MYRSWQAAADQLYRHPTASRRRPTCRSRPPPSPRPTIAMAKTPSTPRELVDRLDARHDELIAKLDELNARIEAALAEFGRARQSDVAVEPAREAA